MRLALIALSLCACAAYAQPLVIAHRGASGSLPEHTLAAYALAIEQGAQFIEPDLVMTKDGVLVARHENEISQTTDVASHPALAARRTTKTIDGKSVTGWFTEDFTLAELKTLRAKERIPKLRPSNAQHDGRYAIPAFSEVLDFLKSKEHVGVYPETKHAGYFASIGLALEEPLVALLHAHGFRGKEARAFIQSFEPASLLKLARLTEVPLIQLIARDPYDLAQIAAYARGIGPNKNLLIPRAPDGSLGAPTSLVRDAHAKGLLVHAWTFRAENHFLPKEFRSGADPSALGDMAGELRRFLDLGMDGYFTDHPGNRGQAPINSR